MDEANVELTEAMSRRYRALWARIRAANPDLGAQFLRAGGFVYYDPEDDCLIVTVGPPTAAATLEVTDVFNLRYEPETLRIVATEVTNLSAYIAANPRLAAMGETLRALGMRAPGTYVPVPAQEALAVAEYLPGLVCA